MTSGTLMLNIVSESAPVQTALTEQLTEQETRSVDSNGAHAADSNGPTGLAKPNKLPYQANHQVELLHLSAEIDALLQQLQSLKQQRLACDPSSEQDSEFPALV